MRVLLFHESSLPDRQADSNAHSRSLTKSHILIRFVGEQCEGRSLLG